MNQQEIPYEKLILVCVNDHHGEKPSCGDHQGPRIFEELRRIAKERGLHPRIRVTQVKCLGQCTKGANIMIYPEGKWISGVSIDDITRLADEHLPVLQQ